MQTTSGESTAPARIVPNRELVNRFFRLTLSQKTEIVGRLDLADEADKGLPDSERYKRALVRARDSHRLGEVGELILEMENRG